jgi:cell pole-organizing protein PopZ
MEEILASIRKIISEDASDAEPAPPPVAAAEPVAIPRQEPKPAAPLPPKVVEEEVLDLTDVVEEEPAPVMITPAPAKAVEPPLQDDVVFQDEEVAMSVAPVTKPQVERPLNSVEQGLFRAHARSAFDEAINSIEAATTLPEAPATPPLSQAFEGPTLAAAFDRAVREAFDPVLRDWLNRNTPDLITRIQPALAELLDRHLPDLLANAVREEIARAKARTGR